MEYENMMQYGNVPGIDKPISRLLQGTIMISSERQAWSFDLLDGIYALGCNTFDTAHVYGRGDCERTLGQWVNSRGIRDKLVIIDKGAHPMNGQKRVTPEHIRMDVRESLERFQFDTIDLYLLHRDDPDVPVGPIMEVLNEHLQAGHIRAFGGSNWTYERLREANEYATAHGLVPFAVTSPNFSLAEQVQAPWEGCISVSYDMAARAWYEQNQMPLFSWSSLAGGFFSGRFRRDNLTSFSGYFDELCVTTYCVEKNFQRMDRVEQMAAETGLSIPQVATAYVMNQPLNIFGIVGCNSPAEFQANMDALALKLPAERLAWLANGSV
jgi:1-deoxyxylulose-5-phosphate synthase